ncbi:prolyl oligopeptidase family serine peptidase [Pseudonocardia sp. CA-107938]|uniref:prolyl oligopeptidase family serine peptidase n=1 Tax=Pseudonocardia sp. CA-107938 TaxID=3240021 RepID=UPI003D8A21A4
MRTAPYGSWPTPFTAERVIEEAVRLNELRLDGADVYWDEGRPAEGGRTQLVRRAADGTVTDLLPDGRNARSAVHEYGGAAWWVHAGVVWFVDWADQRLHRLEPGGDPVALTPEPAQPRADRYADGHLAPDGETVVCVRERHTGAGAADVVNEIVRLAAHQPSEPEVLVSGPDFVASPRISPDGQVLAWLQWNHPDMPWDSATLMVRNLTTDAEAVVAGGRDESVTQPSWQPDGSLWFCSDRTDWWNLYRWKPRTDIAGVVRIAAEIGGPQWRFDLSRYAVLADGSVVFARCAGGLDGLGLRTADGTVRDLDLPFTDVSTVRAAPDGTVVLIAATATSTAGVYRLDPVTGALTVLRAPRDLGVDAAAISVAEPITFPAGPDGRVAHALYYPPVNTEWTGPEGSLPPLVVEIHGGPTAAASPALSLSRQFWTSRGFGVVDVNHGGSTGYGRPFREELRGTWGVLDVGDCIAAARWLAAQGRVDGSRMTIRGGSAGGFTVLAALTTPGQPFAAGADHFGIADLAVLAADTHKFESRYMDRLVGTDPDVIRDRSPIHHVDRLDKPLIVLQGSEDAVVPPAQSRLIVDALRSRGVPVAYLEFEGEQHGFRRAENIRRALEAELSFYAQVLGFELPEGEGIEPVVVEHL